MLRTNNAFSTPNKIFAIVPPRQQWSGTPVVYQKHGSRQSRPQVADQASFLVQLVFGSLEEFEGDGSAACGHVSSWLGCETQEVGPS